ncbi:MAG: RagB/SusD family nutrient uptake outer membrane protein [Bacteroidales bacterium]|nr:RagB/SusD family nutrient uptake outer membrane protein [Bacteroidales bacterium]
MKTINHILYNIVALTFAGLLLTSCGDFVDIKPKDLVSEDNFWDEKNDVDQMVSGVYTAMQGSDFISRCIIWGEGRSDNLYNGYNIDSNTDLYNIERENLLSTNAFTSWASFYRVINKCNIIIEKAPKVREKDPSYTQDDVDATIAEMTAIRSLCYFYLIRAFKDVPAQFDAIYDEDAVTYNAPAPFDSILTKIIVDLESVKSKGMKRYPKDSSNDYNSNCNRITQNGINAILADMYLWSGEYQKAVDACQEVLDDKFREYQEDYARSSGSGSYFSMGSSSGSLSLVKYTSDPGVGYPLFSERATNATSYGSVFNTIFGTGNSFESIFELSFNWYSGSSFIQNTAASSLYGNYLSGGNNGRGFLAPPDALVTDVTASNRKYWLNDKDARFWGNVHESEDLNSGYVNKYVFKNINITREDNGSLMYKASRSSQDLQNLDRNFIFYRLADVMLMQAEAYCMLTSGTDTLESDRDYFQKAFFLIYPLENRSYIGTNTTSDMPRMANYMSRGKMEEYILAARNRELMFEGKRWFDLLRYARRANSTAIVRTWVTPKFTAGTNGGSSALFSSMESLYWPYNKNECKVNPNLTQKTFYAGAEENSSYKNNGK